MRLIAIIISLLRSIIRTVVKIITTFLPFLGGILNKILMFFNRIFSSLPFNLSVDNNVYDATTDWMEKTPNNWEMAVEIAIMGFILYRTYIVLKPIFKKESTGTNNTNPIKKPKTNKTFTKNPEARQEPQPYVNKPTNGVENNMGGLSNGGKPYRPNQNSREDLNKKLNSSPTGTKPTNPNPPKGPPRRKGRSSRSS